MPRLPQPGGDSGEWGSILNSFLSVEHNANGTLRSTGTLSSYAPKANPIFSGSVVVPTPTSATHAVTKAYVDALVVSGAPDADATTKGLIQLAGDLGGTAASPTVPGLADKVETSTTVNGQALTGNVSLTKTDVGLGDADDTSDADKPISTATQTALDAKQNTLVEGTNITIDDTDPDAPIISASIDISDVVLNTDTTTADMDFVVDEDDMVSDSNTKLPTQQSVKFYVDEVSDEVANLPELANGIGTTINTSVPGFVSVNSSFEQIPMPFASLDNTVTETTILSSPYSFPANSLALTSFLHAGFTGMLTNNTGSNQNVTFRFKLGGLTLATAAFSGVPSSVTPRSVRFHLTTSFVNYFGFRAAGTCMFSVGDAGNSLDFGAINKHLDTAILTPTSAVAMDLTVQFGSASANLGVIPIGMYLQRASV